MSARDTTLFQLFLCGLVALGGCKNPHRFGWAETTATAPETQLAQTTVPPSGIPAMTTSDAGESSAIQQSWRKATGWLTLRRPQSASADTEPATDRSVERQLSNKANQPHGLSYPGIPNYLTGEASSSTADRPAISPADESLTRGTPSLVRRSRRPPPDPAPKLPDDQLLASDAAAVESPAKQSEFEAVEPSPEGSLYKSIQSASRSWHMLPSRAPLIAAGHAADSSDPTASTPTNEGLRFSPPDLEKRRTASDVVASTFSHASTSPAPAPTGRSDSAAQEKISQSDRPVTMPRREDLLAKRVLQPSTTPGGSSTADASSAPSADGKQQPAAATGTQWIAKKSESSAQQPMATTTAAGKIARPAEARSVVAETFAADTFGPRRPPTSLAPRIVEASTFNGLSKERASAFPLPPTDYPLPSPTVVGGRAAGPRANGLPQRPISEQPLLTASQRPQASGEERPTSDWTGEANPPARPLVTTPALPATEAQDALEPRATLLPKPLPVTPPPQSYYSYYRRGVLSDPSSLVRRPSPDSAATAPEVEPIAQQPPVESLAPLVDANIYRRQLPPRQEDWATPQTAATQSSQQPATAGTWLTAYQKLVRTNAPSQSPPSEPETVTRQGATKRSLSSEDSP